MKARMPGESQPSLLLTKEENELIFKLLGPRCLSLATSVVQLFTTEGPGHDQWVKRDTGILCLVKDNHKRSYFFRIFCMQRCKMIWEHEVYNQIVYKAPRPFLHTFEAEEYMTAFNFASEDEANILKTHLYEKIELRKQRREERQRQKSMQISQNRMSSGDPSGRSSSASSGVSKGSMSQHHHHHRSTSNIATNNNTKMASQNVVAPNMQQQNVMNGTAVKPTNNAAFPARTTQGVKRNKTRKLTKADIGLPQDFKHVSHVGWDANKGFDIDKLPEDSEKDMRDFFLRAGVSDSQLKDKDTMEFIYDFISKNGGIDAVKEDLNLSEKPGSGFNLSKSLNQSLRAQAPPPVPARTQLPAPPVVNSSSSSSARERETRAAPPPPARAPPPPPPPPLRTLPPPPQQVAAQTPSAIITSAPSAAAAPPPPPPPPPPPVVGTGPPPPPPPMAANATSPPQMDARAALMESIKSGGAQLKRVDVDNDKKPESSGAGDSRSDLLAKIRQGVELRSVAASNEERKAPLQDNKMGLAGALARALEERNKVMHSDSDNSEQDDTTSDGEEWED